MTLLRLYIGVTALYWVAGLIFVGRRYQTAVYIGRHMHLDASDDVPFQRLVTGLLLPALVVVYTGLGWPLILLAVVVASVCMSLDRLMVSHVDSEAELVDMLKPKHPLTTPSGISPSPDGRR